MRIVRIIKRSNFLFFTFIILIGCIKKEKNSIVLTKTETVIDTSKGFFVKYPYVELKDVLKIKGLNKKNTILLNKIYNKNKVVYNIETEFDNSYYKCEVPLKFDNFQIEGIFLNAELEKDIVSKYNIIYKNSFVVVVNFSKVVYKYVYVIDEKAKKIILKDIYYYESWTNPIEIKGKNETVGYYIRFPIDKFPDKVNKKKIYNINWIHNWKKIIDKEEKWDINIIPK